MTDPRFSDKLSYLVIVSLNGSAFRVLRLVIQDDLQVAHLLEVLAAETNDVFELVESVDWGLEGGQVGEGVQGKLGEDGGVGDSEGHVGQDERVQKVVDLKQLALLEICL